MRQIPDRWLNYAPIGKRVEGTRFIAFKVPLRSHISNSVVRHKRLDDRILLEKVPNLGLIIDLTNTQRYYTPDVFESKGVAHEKLMIPGHETPTEQLTNKFKLIVMQFLNANKNNDKLIGVHCTHGVNRTGYLICSYMISELQLKPDDAIRRFNVARGHNIERANYLTALSGASLHSSSCSSSSNSGQLKHKAKSARKAAAGRDAEQAQPQLQLRFNGFRHDAAAVYRSDSTTKLLYSGQQRQHAPHDRRWYEHQNDTAQGHFVASLGYEPLRLPSAPLPPIVRNNNIIIPDPHVAANGERHEWQEWQERAHEGQYREDRGAHYWRDARDEYGSRNWRDGGGNDDGRNWRHERVQEWHKVGDVNRRSHNWRDGPYSRPNGGNTHSWNRCWRRETDGKEPTTTTMTHDKPSLAEIVNKRNARCYE